MTLPNFLIVGTAKSGTMSMCKRLQNHPEIGLSKAFEPDFFALDEEYAKGLDYYAKYFDHCEGKKAVGEKSWTYSVKAVYPNALERVVRHLPDARIIYAVRNPIARMESLWMQCQASGQQLRYQVRGTLSETVREVPLFIESSRYWSQINLYRDHYPDSRIKIVFFDDMKKDPVSFYNSLFDFLGVSQIPGFAKDNPVDNDAASKRFDKKAAAAIRKIPGFSSIRNHLPTPIRNAGRSLLKQPYDGRPEWDRDTLAWTIDQIQDDVHRLLEHTGRPTDFWPLSVDSA